MGIKHPVAGSKEHKLGNPWGNLSALVSKSAKHGKGKKKH